MVADHSNSRGMATGLLVSVHFLTVKSTSDVPSNKALQATPVNVAKIREYK